MKVQTVRTGIMAISLALAVLGTAGAQVPAPISGQSMFETLGVVTAYGYAPPRYPSTWIVPQFVVQYPASFQPYLWIERVRPVVVFAPASGGGQASTNALPTGQEKGSDSAASGRPAEMGK
jgi:hypothetical protein